MNNHLGTRLRRLRRQQGRTLEEIAQRCDCTRSLLSKIETGKSTPPIATLTRIAQALGVDMAALLTDSAPDTVTYTPASAAGEAAMTVTDKGYRFMPLAGTKPGARMQVYLFTAKRGQVKPSALHHAGEEFVHVLDGSMRYRVGNRHFLLHTGDSLCFDAEEDHDLEPVSAKVRYLAVFAGRSERL